jgi:hypothetical protein
VSAMGAHTARKERNAMAEPILIRNDVLNMIKEYDREVYHQGEEGEDGMFTFEDTLLYAEMYDELNDTFTKPFLIGLSEFGYDWGRARGFVSAEQPDAYKREETFAFRSEED